MIGWIDAIIQGLLLGGLYALIALGLSLTFGVMRLVNLAHGDFVVLSAFMILSITNALHINVFLALLVAAPLMFGVGYILQRAILNRTLGGNILAPLLVTFGLSIIIENGLLQVYSPDSRLLDAHGWEMASIPLGLGLAVGVMPLLTFLSAILVILGLNMLFYRSQLGRALRATSDDPHIAPLMGIDERHLFSIAMAIAMAVTAVAALHLGVRANFDPTIGPARLLYAFEAVIIGGLGSFWGTLAGGIVIGVAQTVGAHINAEWQILAGHLAFLVVLVICPRGLFPRAVD
jgi:branched-chain amino acid transport system permease protein